MTDRDRTVIEAIDNNIKNAPALGICADSFITLKNEFLRVIRERDTVYADFLDNVTRAADTCSYCAHNYECKGKDCPMYEEGIGGTLKEPDGTEKYVDFSWSCMDFKYGDCNMMEHLGLPCKDCDFKNHFRYKKFDTGGD